MPSFVALRTKNTGYWMLQFFCWEGISPLPSLYVGTDHMFRAKAHAAYDTDAGCVPVVSQLFTYVTLHLTAS